MKVTSLAGLAVIGIATVAVRGFDPVNNNRLAVHEWGTFTVLQDERGNAIGGVNTDDEPVPAFVHTIDAGLITNQSQVPAVFVKGVPRCDPSITVRLETPVVYFHPPPGFTGKIDLDVRFRGGWLTQYFPDAQVSAPGLENGQFKYNSLTSHTVGVLAWHGLELSATARGPQTTDAVWLWPRKVDAGNIAAVNGEAERFIFYRGVGHVSTPVRVVRAADGQHIQIQADPATTDASIANFGPAWLVDVKEDGRLAMRKSEVRSPDAAEMKTAFSEAEYSTDLSELRGSLRAALISDGLFADEADALLNTWEVSYFRRPGQRLFYLVPRQWTDAVLPMQISQGGYPLPAQVNRVMVGRIELVTPAQRQRVNTIAKGPASNSQWLFDSLKERSSANDLAMYSPQELKRAFEGNEGQAVLRAKMPADYRAYLELGRFRSAVLLNELTRHPTPALVEFVKAYTVAR